ncbi:MAG: hypothetical protein AAF085_13525 [Planctomycetota bacterium]
MVGWFYINEEVAAPIRMLESDEQSGILAIEVAARFVPNRAILRGKTVVEYRHWSERRNVRCLGAERVGNALMIEAVEVGPAVEADREAAQDLGPAEDWLTINGKAYCRVSGVSVSDRPDGHCMFHVGLTDWRDLRIGEDAPLATIGIAAHTAHDNDASITPLLHAARDFPLTLVSPDVEIVRLREREYLSIEPIATDWGDDSTLVVARVHQTNPLRQPTKQTVAIT